MTYRLFACLLIVCGLVSNAHAEDLPIAYTESTVAQLLGEPSSSNGLGIALMPGVITFYDPGHSVEKMRAHPALGGKVVITALTRSQDGQPWYAGLEFATKSDAPKYRTVKIVQSEDPGYVNVMEGGEFASARVIVMIYSLHLLATGERLPEVSGWQWATTCDTVPGLRPNCPVRRVYVAYYGKGMVLEARYYNLDPAYCHCLFENVGPIQLDCTGNRQLEPVRQTAVRTQGQPTLAPPQVPCCGQR